MELVIKVGIAGLNIVYSVFKLLPVRKKIVYISRQMDTTPIDFEMIKSQMETSYPEWQHVILAKRLRAGIVEKVKYIFHMLKQMYHIATAQVVIVDTYCIPVSILRQRKTLVVIQIWHAMGALKKFGYSILDKKEGSSSRMANLMKMHHNYSYVLTSSEYTKPYFAEAFGQPLDKMVVLPLPRADLLLNEKYKEQIREKIFEKYPSLRNTEKEIIIYSPTFRKSEINFEEGVQKLIDGIDYEKYELIVKLHPLTEMDEKDDRCIWDDKFTSLELFLIADYIITDYSAIVFEASLLNKPLFFYTFDYKSYTENRDFYIDFESMLPGLMSADAKEIVNAIEKQEYDLEKVEKFSELMVRKSSSSYTEEFCEFLYDVTAK